MLTSLLPLMVAAQPVVMTAGHAERPDGTVITYWLENREQRSSDVILVLQGTGCEPVASKPNLRHAGNILRPDAIVLLIDKSGADQSTVSPVEGCSQAYWDNYTLSGRVDDCLRVIAALRKQPWWDKRLIVFGGSEGGAVAALLAPLVPETVAVVILSSGTGDSVGDLVRSSLPSAMSAEVPAIFANARKHPTGDERWGGLSYRWWADAVDIVPARSLAQTPAPTLLIHGARDASSPVATAIKGYNYLRGHGKMNVEYRELPDLDHAMVNETGVSDMDAVLRDAGRWIDGNIAMPPHHSR